jgi:hypothetical protein
MMEHNAYNPFANLELSEDAVRLANAVYNTYVQEDYPYLEITVKRLCEIFGFTGYTHRPEELDYIRGLFEELNEPIAVVDFKYGSRVYDWKALQFCSFEKPWRNEDTTIEIVINEMYVAAVREFMEKPFINVPPKES